MKKLAIFLCVVLLSSSQLMIPAFASGHIDLQNMSMSELTELKSEIETEIESRTTNAPIDESINESAVEDTLLSLTTSAVENAFSDCDIAISWAWINYEYKHDGAFCSLKTHIDYKDNGTKLKPDVYSEAYPVDGKYRLVYLVVGDEVLVDKRDSLPNDIAVKTQATYESVAQDILNDDLISFSANDGYVVVTFSLSGSWNNESTRRSFFMKVESICKAYVKIIANDLAFRSVDFVANGDFVDKYGATTNEKAMTCTFSKEVLGKIRWDDFLTENIPNVACDYWCHPALLKD